MKNKLLCPGTYQAKLNIIYLHHHLKKASFYENHRNLELLIIKQINTFCILRIIMVVLKYPEIKIKTQNPKLNN